MTLNTPASLIEQLQNGDVTSTSTVQQHMDKIEQFSSLNAQCLSFAEQALQRAEQLDGTLAESGPVGALHGLPITIKECFDFVGSPSTFGVSHRSSDFPEQNDIYVDALINAGAVVMGKSNVSQLLAFIETDNLVYGKTLHPGNADYSCGGSSGGEGALVGAGLSPLGLGNDIGGSVRVPAAVNGACGIKPTVQRTPDQTRWIAQQDMLPIQSAAGPISQDAMTLQLALQAMNQGAAEHWPVEALGDFRNIDLSALRIGYYDYDGIFPVSQSVKSAIQQAVETLKKLGARVTPYRFPDLPYAESLYFAAMSIDGGKALFEALGQDKPVAQLAQFHKVLGLPSWARRALGTMLRVFGQTHQSRILSYLGTSGWDDVPSLKQRISDYRQRVSDSMKKSSLGQLDAVISPILPVPAYLHGSFQHMGLAGTYALVNNLTGFPAGVACVGQVQKTDAETAFSRIDIAERQAEKCAKNALGLPLSVQITANPWREDVVLALIDALHQANSQVLGDSTP